MQIEVATAGLPIFGGENTLDSVNMVLGGSAGYYAATGVTTLGGATIGRAFPKWSEKTPGFNGKSAMTNFKEGVESFKEVQGHGFKTPETWKAIRQGSKSFAKGGLRSLGFGVAKAFKYGLPFLGWYAGYSGLSYGFDLINKSTGVKMSKTGGSMETLRTQGEFIRNMQKSQGLFAINSLMGREAEFYHGGM